MGFWTYNFRDPGGISCRFQRACASHDTVLHEISGPSATLSGSFSALRFSASSNQGTYVVSDRFSKKIVFSLRTPRSVL
jgi:hypothetical protein